MVLADVADPAEAEDAVRDLRQLQAELRPPAALAPPAQDGLQQLLLLDQLEQFFPPWGPLAELLPPGTDESPPLARLVRGGLAELLRVLQEPRHACDVEDA